MLKFHDIRRLRTEKGLSQAKLAKLMKIPQAMLSQWELEKIDIPDETFSKIQKLLGSISEHQVIKLKKKKYIESPNGGVNEAKRTRKRIDKIEPTDDNIEYVNLLKSLEHARVANLSLKKQPTAISLFSGCGGLSLGFKWAGFKVKGFVEIVDGFRDIYSLNYPETKLIGTDITKITDKEIADWTSKFGAIDVLFGGPPCQGFSLTGKRDHYDPRNQLFKHFARVARILKPKAVLLENVRLLISMKAPDGKYFKDHIIKEFESIGYEITFCELNAKDYGVPQHRDRVFFLGLLQSLNKTPSFPAATHGGQESSDLFSKNLLPYRTFRTATSDLEPLESGEESKNDKWHKTVTHPEHVINWLQDVPEGCSAHDNADPKMRPPSGYNTTYKRLIWDEPSSTISTTFGMISGCRNVHPTNTRSLTIREALRCQSFPDTYLLTGTQGSIRTSIGNAVPPLLAKALANHIRELLHK